MIQEFESSYLKVKNKAVLLKKRRIEPILWICIGFFILAGIALAFYWWNFFDEKLSNDGANWGTFGDYVGGVLGTLFNILGVLLIFLTFKRQEEYSHIERFESTFFSLLTNQRDIVKSIYIYLPDGPGSNFIKRESYEYINYFSQSLQIKFEAAEECLDKESCRQELSKIYGAVYHAKAEQFGHYFRHLYHIIKYVDDCDIKNKKNYCNIIQAQMSDHELYITFYNSLSLYGVTKFYPLLRKYHFFENITSKSKVFDSHAALFYPETDFKNKTE